LSCRSQDPAVKSAPAYGSGQIGVLSKLKAIPAITIVCHVVLDPVPWRDAGETPKSEASNTSLKQLALSFSRLGLATSRLSPHIQILRGELAEH
jgi:hypothetical protein